MTLPHAPSDLSMLLAPDAAGGLAIAALVGLAVGLEREWSGHATGPAARFAGVRTFLLLGSIGGAAGLCAGLGLEIVAAALLGAAGILITAAYWVASRRRVVEAIDTIATPGAARPRPEDPIDATTEVAAVVVLALGVLAGLGAWQLSAGAAAVVVFALAEKGAAHATIERIDARELRAAVQFAVLSLVVLPLLPEGPFGPWGGIRPRQLWIVVLIFSALNFAGHIARRVIGEARGYSVTGLLGGFVSSTAVTLNFARQSRLEPEHSAPLGLGSVAACTVLVLRVCVIVLILNPGVFPALVPLVAPMFLLGAAFVAVIFWRARTARPVPNTPDTHNPLRLWSAVQMAIAFQVVLMALYVVRERWGTRGIYTSAAVLGFTDMDALTLSMTKLGTTAALMAIAARAIVIGILSNTVLKLALALMLGTPSFRKVVAAGLIVLGVVGTATLYIAW